MEDVKKLQWGSKNLLKIGHIVWVHSLRSMISGLNFRGAISVTNHGVTKSIETEHNFWRHAGLVFWCILFCVYALM